MITREANLPRKAMRVAIPLFVELEGVSHPVRDWSTTGIGLAGLAQLPPPGELLPARLSFPMLESTLILPVQLVFRGVHDDVAGFEFHDLSARNRRILRHYIELSVDGKLGDVEDIVAVAALPEANVPAEAGPRLAPVLPGSLEPHRTRPWGSVLLGIAVLATAAAVGFHHLTYQLEGTGFVSGSIARVTANHEGRLGRLLVQPGTQVEPNTPLFAVENPALRDEIQALEQHVAQLGQEQARLAGARRQAESGLLQSLKRDWTLREQELANARKLFESGAITQREVLMVSSQVNDLRHNYLRQVADGATRNQSFESADLLQRMRLDLSAKKVQLARQETERTIRSPVRGKVFHVDRQVGEFVAAQDPVVLLEADVTPSVFLRLPNDDALQLRPGMPATVYVPYLDRRFTANVAAVGLSSAAANVPATQEGGLDQTLVKLEFDDKRVRLPANARVNVWIRNPSLPWS
jgi:multidrug resistance efflux pump